MALTFGNTVAVVVVFDLVKSIFFICNNKASIPFDETFANS